MIFNARLVVYSIFFNLSFPICNFWVMVFSWLPTAIQISPTGFSSVPPFTSWISYIILLLGNGIFWIKFFPAMFGALTLLVIWKTIEELDGDLFALILGAICIVFSSLLRINTLYQPNSFDILSWTSLYFFIIKYFKTHNTQLLFVAAGVFAIGFLNK